MQNRAPTIHGILKNNDGRPCSKNRFTRWTPFNKTNQGVRRSTWLTEQSQEFDES